jgi:hypothetical protein
MKRTIIIPLVLLVAFIAGCNNHNGKNASSSAGSDGGTGKSEIAFREYEHNFGKVAEGEKLSYTFIFENKGTADLILSSASASCGCTLPKFSKKPIAPGQGGNIEVIFDTSGRDGMQTKTVTVKSNASMPVVILKITAEVVSNNQ